MVHKESKSTPTAATSAVGDGNPQPCRDWEKTRSCRFGDTCRFAHGPAQGKGNKKGKKGGGGGPPKGPGTGDWKFGSDRREPSPRDGSRNRGNRDRSPTPPRKWPKKPDGVDFCRAFDQPQGCRRGRQCWFWHRVLKPEDKRCFVCGSETPLSDACTRPKEPRSNGYGARDQSPRRNARGAGGRDRSPRRDERGGGDESPRVHTCQVCKANHRTKDCTFYKDAQAAAAAGAPDAKAGPPNPKAKGSPKAKVQPNGKAVGNVANALSSVSEDPQGERILMDSRATHWLSVLKGGAKVSDLSSRLALCVGDVPCRLVTGDKGMPVCELLDPGGKPIKKVVTLWWLIDTGCIQGWAGRLPNMSFWIDSPPKADGSRQRFVAEFRNKLPTLSRSELDVLLALLPDDREPANCSVAISCVSPCLAAAPVDLSFLDRGDRDKKNIERKYEAMPERFYGPGLDPVGPSKLESRVGDRLSESGSSSEPAPACRCDVWEWFSGTGWLSHWARGGGLKTGPPMDYRHGFDAQYPPHPPRMFAGRCV